MNRRTFLQAALLASPPIVDTHIHLFDTARRQGVPWPDKGNTALFQPALPPRLRSMATPHGVTGAIAIECSPWLDDNQWLLDTAATDPFLLGVVGNLEPGQPAFRAQLDKFWRNPLWLGIRYGNLWGRDLSAAVRRPEFIVDLKALAQAGLVLDTANPNAKLLGGVLEVATRVPELRIVVDHLAGMAPSAQWQELAQPRQI
jgi:L-fuconolactonase